MKIAAISLSDMSEKWDRLGPNEEGIAWRFLRKIYAYDGQIPADDRGHKFVGWDVRGYRPRLQWLLSDPHLGFYVQDGMLRHVRSDEEIEAVKARKEAASEAGKRGAKARADAATHAGTTTGTDPGTTTGTDPGTDHLGASNSLKTNDATIASPSPSPSPSLLEKKDSRPSRAAPVDDGAFDLFWVEYPRRDGKAAARKAFDKARRSIDLQALLEAVRRYRAQRVGQDQKFTAMAASWLNGARWEDASLGKVRPTASAANPPPRDVDLEIALGDYPMPRGWKCPDHLRHLVPEPTAPISRPCQEGTDHGNFI
jgi:uncharacterized protein YdaU (DUF1376 family)